MDRDWLSDTYSPIGNYGIYGILSHMTPFPDKYTKRNSPEEPNIEFIKEKPSTFVFNNLWLVVTNFLSIILSNKKKQPTT